MSMDNSRKYTYPCVSCNNRIVNILIAHHSDIDAITAICTKESHSYSGNLLHIIDLTLPRRSQNEINNQNNGAPHSDPG